jgi:hypothetical protein
VEFFTGAEHAGNAAAVANHRDNVILFYQAVVAAGIVRNFEMTFFLLRGSDQWL